MRAPLSTHKTQQLKRGIVTEIVKQFHSYKTEKIAFQRGRGFASLLPLLLGHIVAGISRLIKGK